MEIGPPLRIGIALFEGVEELDWVGPWEVLASWRRHFPDDGVDVFTLSREQGLVDCAKGARVLADHTWDDPPPIDVLLFPGGRGTRPMLNDETVRAWVRDRAETARIMTSVCTGSLVYADAGLLAGRPATTHWASLDLLAQLDPTIEIRPDDRFVDDGDVVTSAGVSAGIDMALHLVARLHSPDRAREIRRYIQYDPQPPV
jgi:transcriptional regulator GlxA family with amidase domain